MQFSKTCFSLINICVLLLFTFFAKAQDSSNSSLEKKSYLNFSLSYLTNAVYYGRKDSFTLPYISPQLTYHDKSGFYIRGDLSYLAGSGAQIDAGSISAGYEFNSANEKFSGDVYASKIFTNTSSYSVKGEVKSALGSSLNYNAGAVSIDGGADLSFSNKTDVALTLGLSHEFQLDDNKSWAATPTILVNAGTQNFYENYFTNRKFSRKRRRLQNTNAVNVIVINKSFSVLDYELSLPVNYYGHKYGFFITPAFSIPENPFTYSLNNGTTYQTENLSRSFYVEIGGYLKF